MTNSMATFRLAMYLVGGALFLGTTLAIVFMRVVDYVEHLRYKAPGFTTKHIERALAEMNKRRQREAGPAGDVN